MRRFGFTLIEILISLAILAVLAAILIPVLGGAMEKGRQANCIGQLQQIGLALAAYKSDHGSYPDPAQLSPIVQLVNDHKLPKILTCPNDPEKSHDSYAMIYNYYGMAQTHTPQALESLAEAKTVFEPLNDNTHVYWSSNPLKKTEGPGDAFPGLINPGCPPNTIAIVCPHHETHGHKYTVLTVGGVINHAVAAPGTAADNTFWTLGKAQ
jgi:prepilin-type N-terminal cleavage/methylation domain-containing protein